MRRYFILLAASWCCLFNSSCKTPTDETLTVIIAGDLLLDRGVRKVIERKGSEKILTGVKEEIRSADYFMANLECPVATSGAPLNKRYIFNGEKAWLNTLHDSGLDAVALANNHTIDYGREGLKSTIANLNEAGMLHAGGAHTMEMACKPLILEKGKQKLAIFSWVNMKIENWEPLPEKYSLCQYDAGQMAVNIREYKTANPNTKIMVTVHWGIEMEHQPMAQQLKIAHELIDAGCDLIVGHHPHVVQSISMYKGKPIIYSVGNFVFDQSPEMANKAIMLEVQLSGKNEIKTGIHLIQIDNCFPRKMNAEEASEFTEMLEKISPNVDFSSTSINTLTFKKR